MENKILIITSLFPKELTRLYGLVDKNEIKNEQFNIKIKEFYENKKDLIKNFNKYDTLYRYFKELKNKYKDKIIFINQEVDNKFQELDIDCLNVQGNLFEYYCEDCNLINKTTCCSKCYKENLFYNITLKDDKKQYKSVIDLINVSQNLICIGNILDLDPTLYLDDFVDNLYINTEEIKYNGQNPYIKKEERDKNYSDFFYNKLILDDLNKSIETIDIFIKNKLSEKTKINIDNPYKNKGEEIITIINDFFKVLQEKHNIKNLHYDRRIVNRLKKVYPFTKKLPELYIHNIWFTYCYDTKRNPAIVTYDDLFYDMLLVYSKYRWTGVKKYFTTRPKISLTIAYNTSNEKAINLFKNLIFKEEEKILI